MGKSLSTGFINNKSAKYLGALFFAMVALSAQGSTLPGRTGSNQAEFGISALRFQYEEFNNTGGILDKELGGIPGVSARLTMQRSGWEWESNGSYHHGQVPYAGQTNLGVPYNTRTDETIGDVSMRFGYWFKAPLSIMPFIGIGYRRWDRNILPNSLGGLFESYRWKYAWAGSKFRLSGDTASGTVLDIGLLKPLNPELKVDFKVTYNVEPTVYPEGKLGLRIMSTTHLAFTRHSEMVIEPYYEFWELGRSPDVTAGSVTLYEPASKTRNLGLNVRFALLF